MPNTTALRSVFSNSRLCLLALCLLAQLALASSATAEEKAAEPGDDLQAILDRGDDLLLKPGALYKIETPLRYKRPGQRISTLDANTIGDYARLQISSRDIGELINGNHLDNIVLENVILDGNRYRLSAFPKKLGTPSLVFFGGNGAERQIVRQCVFMNTRTWSTLKVHEGGSDILVEDNIILGAGHDVRGNGREALENPRNEAGGYWYNWGDGITCAARRTTVRNNLILDPTDVGIVFFGAPGSLAEDNVIATLSRESLGGINLVDPLSYYAFEDDPSLIDYRGTTLRNNRIDARGGRIHMAIPVGATPWVPSKKGFFFVGGEVSGNLITGDAAAYGIVVSGVSGFKITGNRAKAKFSGIAEGEHQNPPDEPGPFIYEPEFVKGGELQPEFKQADRHLRHLLRCNHLPRNYRGYRDYAYGEHEVRAVARTAYMEMLGREPANNELAHATSWLNESKASADTLRKSLMTHPEFIDRHGAIDPEDIQLFREALWLDAIDKALGDLDGEWKPANDIYESAWQTVAPKH